MISTSVVIPTLNAERWLPALITKLAQQKPAPPDKIILVDSGSRDRTLTLAKGYDRVEIISIVNFTHGRARNIGIQAAVSDIVALMTQDAIPADNFWLARLTAPLADPNVAGSFARQIPRPDASPMELFFLMDRFPPGERVARRHQGAEPPTYPATFFSNVSSAARRDTWLKFPFDENLLMSEDQQFARDVLVAGLSIVYEPNSVVIHSHNYSAWQTFKRYFDSVVAFRQLSGRHGAASSISLGLSTFFRELTYITCTSPLHLPSFFLHQLAKAAGTFTAHASPWLPRAVRARCSMQPGWWAV